MPPAEPPAHRPPAPPAVPKLVPTTVWKATPALIVALDEHGKTQSSEAFASQLARWRDDGRPAVSFVIGGADGHDPGLVAGADVTLSFSPLTWPHQLVRIMLAEQLYRATTILSGHPYHRG